MNSDIRTALWLREVHRVRQLMRLLMSVAMSRSLASSLGDCSGVRLDTTVSVWIQSCLSGYWHVRLDAVLFVWFRVHRNMLRCFVSCMVTLVWKWGQSDSDRRREGEGQSLCLLRMRWLRRLAATIAAAVSRWSSDAADDRCCWWQCCCNLWWRWCVIRTTKRLYINKSLQAYFRRVNWYFSWSAQSNNCRGVSTGKMTADDSRVF